MHISRREAIVGAFAAAFAKPTAPIPVDWNPVMIGLVRRMMPSLIAYDIIGVQPMIGPCQEIFSFKPAYKNCPFTPSYSSIEWINNDHLYYLWEDPIV